MPHFLAYHSKMPWLDSMSNRGGLFGVSWCSHSSRWRSSFRNEKSDFAKLSPTFLDRPFSFHTATSSLSSFVSLIPWQMTRIYSWINSSVIVTDSQKCPSPTLRLLSNTFWEWSFVGVPCHRRHPLALRRHFWPESGFVKSIWSLWKEHSFAH